LILRQAYEESLARHGRERDAEQDVVVDLLGRIQDELVATDARPRSLLDRFRRRPRYESVRGAYIWGGVGRGKTFLMDLFFQTLPIEQKRRGHFHRIVKDVHDRLADLGSMEDPLDRVADDLAKDVRVLCFDEFFVSDIGDAMILGRLLERLFERGITLIATSNVAPARLYAGGLQRQRFLPAIAAIERHTNVVHLGGDLDYRLRLLEQAGTYLLSTDSDTQSRLESVLSDAASAPIESNRVLEIHGRDIVARWCGKTVAWFDFDELCDGPRSQDDYIEISRLYKTVIVSDVPRLDYQLDNQARRFIAMVDEFYDRRVKLVLSASAPLVELYAGQRLAFEFERTTSRLIEMQSGEYLHLAHRP